jgi:hypothetical protein
MPTTSTTAVEPWPCFGEPVVVEVVEGFRVRDPLSMRVINEPITVAWSVFFQRRLNDGTISIAPYTTAQDESSVTDEEI